jgi:hypothetical protein
VAGLSLVLAGGKPGAIFCGTYEAGLHGGKAVGLGAANGLVRWRGRTDLLEMDVCFGDRNQHCHPPLVEFPNTDSTNLLVRAPSPLTQPNAKVLYGLGMWRFDDHLTAVESIPHVRPRTFQPPSSAPS